jgi:hypothetical protein
MSPDASNLLDSLTVIDNYKVTGSFSIRMEMLKRGYSKITSLLMGDGGFLIMQAVMIFINALRGVPRSRKKESN